MTTTLNPTSLIQRRGNAELPTGGLWTLHGASFVAISTRRHRARLSVSEGSLRITDPPATSTLSLAAVLDDRCLRLVASTVVVEADAHGFSSWHLVGTVDAGNRDHAVEVALSYHGVRRRGDQAWAWFTGQAATPTPGRRWRRRRAGFSLELDLLFTPQAPDTQSDAEAHAPSLESGATALRRGVTQLTRRT